MHVPLVTSPAQETYQLLELPPETRLFMCHDYKAPGRDHYAWETTVGEQRARTVRESLSRMAETSLLDRFM